MTEGTRKLINRLEQVSIVISLPVYFLSQLGIFTVPMSLHCR